MMIIKSSKGRELRVNSGNKGKHCKFDNSETKRVSNYRWQEKLAENNNIKAII